ncbi:hypothetical protein M0R45_007750 [Rubus argutus]|uniref:laccase n=1 Tax=Rubus argutus TaxID=59490 RepID=A0AAW1XYQ6_RUBAR
MWSKKWISALQILFVLVFFHCQASAHYHWVVKEATYTRLCSTKKILTVDGKFPGPILRAYKGDTIYVNVHNGGRYNITIHVHGAIFVYPKSGTSYPFPKPHHEVPIILAEWWKKDVMEVLEEFVRTGGAPNVSDAYTINGQPGDLYPCSKSETFKLSVSQNKTYLLRIVNAVMNEILFFAVANHKLTVVATDASYTKPIETDYITISPGQSMDALLVTNQQPGRYYMAARAYSTNAQIGFDNTTTTAIVEYNTGGTTSSPLFPYLPSYNDTNAAFNFFGSLKSLAFGSTEGVPKKITTRIVSTQFQSTHSLAQKIKHVKDPMGHD